MSDTGRPWQPWVRMGKGVVKDAWQRLPGWAQPARVRDRKAWAIGIYEAHDPLAPRPVADGPVLTKRDVGDVHADFVADPFLVHRDGLWYMLMEVFNRARCLGEIGLASSVDGRRWTYEQIVLREPFHLSYPCVVEADGVYVVPEASTTQSVRLYRAEPFPYRWRYVGALLDGRPFRDPTLFHHDGRWWLFAETGPRWQDGVLRLYHAEGLTGPWVEHPRSPVVDGDPRIARPAGRVLVHDGGLVRFTQDCSEGYGKRVYAARITRLSTSDYAETPLLGQPVLEGSGSGWNANRLHHIDLQRLEPGRWLAAVDGH